MKAILFDLDGVLYMGSKPIPGAADVIRWLREENIPHMFLTNTTSKTPDEILENLFSMNIPIERESLWTPVKAAAKWLKDQKIYGPVGLFVKENVKKEFSHIETTKSIVPGLRAVLIGDMVDDWSIENLNLALQMLIKAPDSALIALGMTRYYMSPEGYRLDVGSIAAALEYATGKKPLVLGKPAEDYFAAALNILNVKPRDTVMIGDDIVSDIRGAQSAGIKGILVKTGKFRESDLVSGIEPHAVLDSVADLPHWFEKSNV